MSSIRTFTENRSMQMKWSETLSTSTEYSPSGKKQRSGSSNKAENVRPAAREMPRTSKSNPPTATDLLLIALSELSSERALRMELEDELKELKALRKGEKTEMRALKAELKELKALKEKERSKRHDLETQLKESNTKLRVSEEKRERQRRKFEKRDDRIKEDILELVKRNWPNRK